MLERKGCDAQEIASAVDPFTGSRLKAILVMKAAENRVGDYVVTVTNPMIVQHGSDVGAIVRVSLPDRPAWRRLW